jgi:acyl carrier protein
MNESLIRNLIAEHLAVPSHAVTDTALFQQDLGADSLDMIQLCMLVENRLGVPFDDEEAERCPTVGDALRLLRGKVAAFADA